MNIHLGALTLHMIIGATIGALVTLALYSYLVGPEVPLIFNGVGAGVGAWVGQLSYLRKAI